MSTMQMLFSTPVAGITAVSMLVFSLLYTPCVAAVASIRREMGNRWAIGVVLWQCLTAWVVTLLFHLVGLALGFGA